MKKLVLIVFTLLLPVCAFSQTGWIRITKGSTVFFKPFVDVKNYENKEVLFVTSTGKVYSGKCRSKRKIKTCRIFPGKRFPSASEDILYIIVKMRNHFAPKIVKFGRIDNFNVIEN